MNIIRSQSSTLIFTRLQQTSPGEDRRPFLIILSFARNFFEVEQGEVGITLVLCAKRQAHVKDKSKASTHLGLQLESYAVYQGCKLFQVSEPARYFSNLEFSTAKKS